MTPFELKVKQVAEGTFTPPSVSVGSTPINFFGYQLSVHHFNMKLMAKGFKFRNIKFSDIKNYYGLKGRSAKDCLGQFEEIMNNYLKGFQEAKTASQN